MPGGRACSRQWTARSLESLWTFDFSLDTLAERDPEGVLPARLEGALFAALDGEGDGRIAGQLEAALRTLLRPGAGAEPARWLAACTRVALAAPARDPSPSPDPKTSGTPISDPDAADEEGTLGGTPADSSKSPSSDPQAPGQAADAGGGFSAAPRLRTRVFAARCVLDMLGAVGTDARHWDPAAAATDARGDWLVAQLPALVDTGFRMATGQVGDRRPDLATGVRFGDRCCKLAIVWAKWRLLI